MNGKLKCGTADVYWNLMTEVAAPVVAALSKVDDAMRQKIKEQVFEIVSEKYPGNIAIDANALVISAVK